MLYAGCVNFKNLLNLNFNKIMMIMMIMMRMAKKCTKIQNARAQLLFCSSNLLSGDVPGAVAVVIC